MQNFDSAARHFPNVSNNKILRAEKNQYFFSRPSRLFCQWFREHFQRLGSVAKRKRRRTRHVDALQFSEISLPGSFGALTVFRFRVNVSATRSCASDPTRAHKRRFMGARPNLITAAYPRVTASASTTAVNGATVTWFCTSSSATRSCRSSERHAHGCCVGRLRRSSGKLCAVTFRLGGDPSG